MLDSLILRAEAQAGASKCPGAEPAAAVQRAINQVLAAIKDVVNQAIGFPLV